MLVVRGEGDIEVSVGVAGGGGEGGAAAEVGVVGFQDFGGSFRGGSNNGGELPEVEADERAVLLGEVAERNVGSGAEEVEVAEQRNGEPWGWW